MFIFAFFTLSLLACFVFYIRGGRMTSSRRRVTLGNAAVRSVRARSFSAIRRF
jgi:hypothetical protein